MNKTGFEKVVQTLKLYHRISKDDFNSNKGNILLRSYVDLLPNDGVLKHMTNANTTFLIGKKGTGKSTIIAAAEETLRNKDAHLLSYVNAKTIFENVNNLGSFSEGSKYLNKKEAHQILLVQTFINELCKDLIEEMGKSKNWFSELIHKDHAFKSAVESLKTRAKIKLTTELDITKIQKISSSNSKKSELSAEMSAGNSGVNAFGDVKDQINQGEKMSQTFTQYLDINGLIEEILLVIKASKKDKLYIYIDDYSELAYDDIKLFMDTLLAPLYFSGEKKIVLKIAGYPNRIYYGNLDTNKYDVLNIDAYDIYGKINGINSLKSKTVDYTRRILNNRASLYTNGHIEQFFNLNSDVVMDDYYEMLSRASMGIPRILGNILDKCLSDSISYDKAITKTVINDASREHYEDATSQYFHKVLASKDLSNNQSFDEKADILVQKEIIENLIKKAQKLKIQLGKTSNKFFQQLEEVPTGHFTVDNKDELFLKTLEFNGYIYKVGETASKEGSKIGDNATLNLYAFDYGLCLKNKIVYDKGKGVPNKFYQQRGLNFTSDIYQTIHTNKYIECDKGHTFDMNMLQTLQTFGMRCPECLNKEIISDCKVKFNDKIVKDVTDETNNAIWTTVELDILLAIRQLNEDKNHKGNVTANLIEKIIDISSRSIGQHCKSLSRGNYVIRAEKNPYLYKLTEDAIVRLKAQNL